MVIIIKDYSKIPLVFVPMTHYQFVWARGRCSKKEFIRCLDVILEQGKYSDLVFFKAKVFGEIVFFRHKLLKARPIFNIVRKMTTKRVKKPLKPKFSYVPKWDRGPEEIEVKPGKFRVYKRLVLKYKEKNDEKREIDLDDT